MARFHLVAGHKHEGGSVDFSADDVSHALSLAYQLTAGHTFELWQEKRKICTIHSRAGLPAIGGSGPRSAATEESVECTTCCSWLKAK